MSSDPLFRMVVQDVFSIARRGTVVTGRIEAGSLKAGDEIMIRGPGHEKKAIVGDIESFRKILPEANQGDSVGILLKDVARSDVQPGDELLSPASDFSWKP
jgi:elongation factor Tu